MDDFEAILSDLVLENEPIEKELSSLGLKWHSFDDLCQALRSETVTDNITNRDCYDMWHDIFRG